ncbi:SDR family oxidoreductase [Exiguobacterium sp. TBG-PICH-001]|uniref:SDR family oxidoreductase n=1 Tax=Exiguobacterium abrahamii TaxID=2785532 RepID=UPI0018A792EC|nr:SDR family oxidoreductase [Exiguobacterium sp. TBG-PICH-001]MBF8152954.1 SDR family oxidoreductase [Exiguobacterium sp. TBG-PICH-001]
MKTGFIAITGATSGIGHAIARTFIQKGYRVLLLGRRIDRLESLASDDVLVRQVAATDRAALDAALADATEAFGPVEAIINNAGRMLLGQIETQDAEEWEEMFDVNALGVLHGMQAVLPSMVERKTGTIINISSIAGKKTFADHAAYVGTKFAVHAMSENVRSEVASHGVRVMTIAPGVVETELLGHTTSDAIKDGYNEWKQSIDGGLDPQVVADTVLFVFEQPQHVNIREIVLAPTKQLD